jgi:hypothetical protein
MTAMNIVLADEVEFGAPKGIYFIKARLRPIYTVFLLAHELTHTVFGQRSPDKIAAGIEEGLAEVLAAFFLMPRLDHAIGKNLFLYNRIYPLQGGLADRYLPFSRLAGIVALQVGWVGFLSLYKEGRERIRELETAIYAGRPWTTLVFETDCLNSSERADIEAAVFAADPLLFCSPAAYLVGEMLNPGMTVKEIAHITTLPEPVVREAISELQSNFSFAILSKDQNVVVYSYPIQRCPGVLRFLI